MATTAFKIGEVWNPVCCDGNKYVFMIIIIIIMIMIIMIMMMMMIIMVTKLLSSHCGAHLVEPYYRESNIPDPNWLRYLFLTYLIKLWMSL